jgi:hypothetical protein
VTGECFDLTEVEEAHFCWSEPNTTIQRNQPVCTLMQQIMGRMWVGLVSYQ